MRAFGIAVAATVIFAAIAGFTLNVVQMTSAQAYKSGEAGLNHEEDVNNYGRQG